ncbi:MAG TPA: aspartyl/asparaginyl beta-hydroxylase domain-containing protein [Casimicrobiaceae bacterium]|nr:aspartyl/asparaginyl beta-hydroxylase domain-containing protein [Casimicrobiaceae bacterium]
MPPSSISDPAQVLAAVFAPKFLVVYVFVAAALFVHFRGRVRHSLMKQLSDHSTIMAPYNALMYLFSAVPPKPILDPRSIPELDVLRANWKTIRDEAVALMDQGSIRAATGHNDLGFNSFFKNGWKRFYVKWYGAPIASAQSACPKTVALVESLPNVNAAMFALLPPGAKLNRHRDPFAGSLRYHLGLVTPNSDRCRIYVDGQPYWWRDGEDLLFDETYIHSAQNETDVTRIILFCDVERPLRTPVMRAVNRLFARHIMRAASTQNLETEPIGLLNRVYALFGHSSDFLGRLKRKNRTVFRAVKYALIALAAYFIFVH